MDNDVIFQPLKFRNLTVKNRLFRSNVTKRFDNYDGSGTQARINWEEQFARGGVGAILSSFVPVSIRGRVQPNYAAIDDDDKIPFWRRVGEAVHRHDCRFILQLSHSGRQRDIPGVENMVNDGLWATGRDDYFHGLLCHSMTTGEIQDVIRMFAEGARRAKAAGLDGVELHASHGYLFTQFLSSGINDRDDEYGGPLKNRARFLIEVIRAIRKEVGDDFFLGVKTNAVDFSDALYPRFPFFPFNSLAGNTLEESIQVCQWAEEAGADALHISVGSIFPHPLLPSGGFPADEANWWYGIMASSGVRAFTTLNLFHFRMLRPLFLLLWNRTKKDHPVEGVSAEYAREVKKHVKIPVINTGGYQDARLIRAVISRGWCDAVSIARPLIANPDLPEIIRSGKDLPDSPCTFCNRCLLNAIANPLGCYDVRRFGGDQDAMIRRVMSVFRPDGFGGHPPIDLPAPTPPTDGPGQKARTKVRRWVLPDLDRTEPHVLIDQIRESPVDLKQLRLRTRLRAAALLLAALLLAAAALVAYYRYR
jgi:2,4-dienoyl-CoA reductase (NADPH2)